ncbi:thioesterase II family protein [Streptomyces coeruleorubidus]|uniref:thioesterase II family protein n=1 Tax=Streptomyces coeruleorubidus TaxID=116188 RepID=UPI0037B2DE0D
MTSVNVAGDAWIRRFHASPDRNHRLVCFPHAGGAASTYHRLSMQLTPDVEVLSVQYPGRHDRHSEPLIDSIPVLADHAHAALRAWIASAGAAVSPALFGHSMGAVVAFEVARRMEADGTPPAHLFVSGRRAPSRYREEYAHLLDDDRLLREITALGGTESAVLADPDLRRMVLPVVRNDYKAIETYGCPPDAVLAYTPVTALVGDSDPRATLEETEAWRDHTKARFAMHVFDGGGHFYLADSHAQVASLVAAALRTGA